MELPPGLYESLVTLGLQAQLQALPQDRQELRQLRLAEAPDRVALHVQQQVERALAAVPEQRRLDVGLAVARGLLERLAELAPADPASLPLDPLAVLGSVRREQVDATAASVESPLIPVLDTTLLTNAPGEPSLWSQLRSEIDSADSIDLVMAFIRRSGLRPLEEALRRHTDRGRRLRVLTTTYTGSTEQEALDLLIGLGAEVQVSYDNTGTRLHAKGWLFTRASGYSTAYIGSSNLTHSAQVTGQEWNLRASGVRNPGVLEKVVAVFDSYWASGDFLAYDAEEFAQDQQRTQQGHAESTFFLSPLGVRLEPFQERLLELVQLARARGKRRNLLVSATGTGKTVMAAIDYSRLRDHLGRARLLFIAHREEILQQALGTFRHALREPTFGEVWVRGKRPKEFQHVFASIQSLHANGLHSLVADHFDVVIVDEFHHARADTYDQILRLLQPQELLALTATPERSDGRDVLHYFDGEIAAELRLWDAIAQHHLAPFAYYGVHDGTDLTHVPWSRNKGYDPVALTDLYAQDTWADRVLHEVGRHVAPLSMRCLGFCVTVKHAEFMAEHFQRHGVAATAVSEKTPPGQRRQALLDLAAGRLKAVFSVDLFNEGVDVPAVDMLLMLRPTESPTLFIQQLGRGLRKKADKGACTVLDFVGTHRAEFRYDRRFRALLGGTRRELEKQVRDGFPFLPPGCSLQLDEKSSEVILRSLRDALPSTWRQKAAELRSHLRQGKAPDLGPFLEESGLELEDVYVPDKGWSQLLRDAGGRTQPDGPHQGALERAIGRLLHLDDEERIDALVRLLGCAEAPMLTAHTQRDQRLLHMLLAQVTGSVVQKDADTQAGLDLMWAHPQVLVELQQLLPVLRSGVSHVNAPLALRPRVPLQIHARYSRLEILAAMGSHSTAKIPSWQSGVQELPRLRTHLLAFTLDKTSGAFSPSTRYRDYAISSKLIHWESQRTTSEQSRTGQQYIHHLKNDVAVLLFARLRDDERSFWFLGPADYVSHVGERPMSITWRLHHPLSGDLFAQFAAAVA